jgi:hypothetical protein
VLPGGVPLGGLDLINVSGANIRNIEVSDLSRNGISLTNTTAGMLENVSITNIGHSAGWAGVALYTTTGNTDATFGGASLITNTSMGLYLEDTPGRSINLIAPAGTVNFSGQSVGPLLRLGYGTVPNVDATALGLGLPAKVSSPEAAPPNDKGAAYYATIADGLVGAVLNPAVAPYAILFDLQNAEFHVGQNMWIQIAIRAATPGNIINVHPGTYNQDEANGYNASTGGAGSNNFNIFVNKSVTIRGVDNAGAPITNHSNVLAQILAKRNKPEFGPDAIFVQADNVTITGLEISGWSGVSNNKSIEATGDNLILKHCKVNGLAGMPFYISDYNFNSSADTSHVQSYRLEGNVFYGTGAGRGVSISSGAGWTGSVNNRVILGNIFINNNPAIALVGPGGDPWDVYPVGAAIISGNVFSQSPVASRQVLAWGIYQSAQGYENPDWQGIIDSNTFDRGVIAWTPARHL